MYGMDGRMDRMDGWTVQIWKPVFMYAEHGYRHIILCGCRWGGVVRVRNGCTCVTLRTVRTGPHIMMMVVAYMEELPYVHQHTVGICVERNRIHARGHVHVIPILTILRLTE